MFARTRKHLVGACFAIFVTATVQHARADDASATEDGSVEEVPTYRIRAAVDGPLLTAATVVAASWLLRNELSPPACAPVCSSANVFLLDRFAAGTYRPGWARVSDIGIAALYLSSTATLLFDEGLANGAQDLVVVAEAAVLSHATATTLNYAVRRPRPFAYGQSAPLDMRTQGNAGMSFFSGHTAGAFAAATALSATWFRRHPHSPFRFLVLGAGLATASVVGTTRILAGDHFPTDVIIGALVGGSFGILVPALHDTPVRLAPMEGGLQAFGTF